MTLMTVIENALMHPALHLIPLLVSVSVISMVGLGMACCGRRNSDIVADSDDEWENLCDEALSGDESLPGDELLSSGADGPDGADDLDGFDGLDDLDGTDDLDAASQVANALHEELIKEIQADLERDAQRLNAPSWCSPSREHEVLNEALDELFGTAK